MACTSLIRGGYGWDENDDTQDDGIPHTPEGRGWYTRG